MPLRFAQGAAPTRLSLPRPVIQPGGSKRGAEVIEACKGAGVAMVFTKHRHSGH
jgi:phosphoribosylaminoimidazolecarboxamide formyltransferase/IMP cyclohydrolase